MNGKASKALRKALQKATAEDATRLINEHTSVLNNQVLPNQNALQARCENMDRRLKVLESLVRQLLPFEKVG
jgi:hypothetical protein